MSDQDVKQRPDMSDKLLEEEITVQLDGAEAVKGLVQMGVGKLLMHGGAEALLTGAFTYPLPTWKPDVAYHVEDGQGLLDVKQPEVREPFAGDPTYVWDLAFNDAVPLDVALRLGAGHADIRLGGTSLTSLEAAIGSGSLMADLSGDLPDLSQISMTVGSGRSGLVLGGTYAALHDLDVTTASGVAEVALGGHYPQMQTLKINGASGRTSLGMTGSYPELERLVLNSASGVIDLNLGEALEQDLDAAIRCVSGVITVDYPAEAGVSVRFTSLTGKLEAPGFSRRQGRYVNEIYDNASFRLHLNVSTVSGKLTLQPTTL
jgi:hypothetical protein